MRGVCGQGLLLADSFLGPLTDVQNCTVAPGARGGLNASLLSDGDWWGNINKNAVRRKINFP